MSDPGREEPQKRIKKMLIKNYVKKNFNPEEFNHKRQLFKPYNDNSIRDEKGKKKEYLYIKEQCKERKVIEYGIFRRLLRIKLDHFIQFNREMELEDIFRPDEDREKRYKNIFGHPLVQINFKIDSLTDLYKDVDQISLEYVVLDRYYNYLQSGNLEIRSIIYQDIIIINKDEVLAIRNKL